MTPSPPTPVTVDRFYKDHAAALKMRLVTKEQGLERRIREATVNRPGLALAGFRKYFAPKRIQVIGNCEVSYLRSLKSELRLTRYRDLFAYRIPCVVVCRGLRPDRALLDAADRMQVPVFQSDLITMKFINLATLALESMFAPRGELHGCMADIQGIGTIILGESGIGKSEAILSLIERGHSLVADDVVKLRLIDGIEVVGMAKDEGRNMMEVRGIGIVNVAATFGVAAIRGEKRVDCIVTLKQWEEAEDVDRLGLDDHYTELLGLPIPTLTIPVRPGRDLGRLIEVAAFEIKLRQAGYNAAEEFTRRLALKMGHSKHV